MNLPARREASAFPAIVPTASNRAGDSRTDLDGIRPLEPAEFELIRQLAYRTFGLDLKPGKEELVSSRLRRLVAAAGFHSYREYYRHVVGDATGKALCGMVDALATNHTAFLREPEHFEFLKREVLPLLSAREATEIWCAACATGEEVWTLGFVLNDCKPAQRTCIRASDISNNALQFASRALYSADRCRDLPGSWLSRYFTPEQGSPFGYRVVPAVRAQASFHRINLIEPLPWTRTFPLIFCRNVMIYFDGATQERVVRQLSDCLEPGGFLIVGHAETLTAISHSLEYVQPAVYRKPGRRGRSRK